MTLSKYALEHFQIYYSKEDKPVSYKILSVQETFGAKQLRVVPLSSMRKQLLNKHTDTFKNDP